MKGKEEEEKRKLIDDIREFSKENPIIVEGIKDRGALANIGIESNPYSIGIEEFSDKIKKKYPDSKKVLILTDYDKRGELLRKNLKEALSRLGIEENLILRRKFYRITKLVHVEGLRV